MIEPLELKYASGFFDYSRERESIRLKREAGCPPPWTTDKHLQTWRFCNVSREDDRTTVWFRENVRSKLSGLAVVQATVIFRWFNRIETGEVIKDLLLDKWDSNEAKRRLTGVAPVVTGAYIIRGYEGFSKLEGILHAIDDALPQLPRMVETWGETLQQPWKDLTTLNCLGGFMSYEIVSDLRWTPVLENANDIMTWCNAGPGAARGLGWLVDGKIGRFNTGPGDQRIMLPLMRRLLEMSQNSANWPTDWKPWDMRTVEHGLCELDKYLRTRSGFPLKRRYTYKG